MLTLKWMKCGSDEHWCSFTSVDLSKVTTFGVYIIWHEGNPSRVVYVGQGNIADRLNSHRTRPDIAEYAALGTLRVTWAAVAAHQAGGVERYLADQYPPLVGDAHPNVTPIAVNSPW